MGSFKIGRIFGVDIGVHWSWIFIFAIVTWSFATGVLDRSTRSRSDAARWGAGVIIAFIFFISILLHELSHSVVSNRNGLPVRNITLFVFGGVSNLTREPDTPGLEFRIAIVGPLTSLALGRALRRRLGSHPAVQRWDQRHQRVPGADQRLARRVQHAARASRWTAAASSVRSSGSATTTACARRTPLRCSGSGSPTRSWASASLYTFFGGIFAGVWFLIIGFFLRNASVSSYDQLLIETTLSQIRVRDMTRTDIHPIEPGDDTGGVGARALPSQRSPRLRRRRSGQLRRARHADRRAQVLGARSGRRPRSTAR